MHCKNNSHCDNITMAVFFLLLSCISPKSKPQASHSTSTKLRAKVRVMIKLSYRTIKHESFWNTSHKIWGVHREMRQRFRREIYRSSRRTREFQYWRRFQLNNHVKYCSWLLFMFTSALLCGGSYVFRFLHASSNTGHVGAYLTLLTYLPPDHHWIPQRQ